MPSAQGDDWEGEVAQGHPGQGELGPGGESCANSHLQGSRMTGIPGTHCVSSLVLTLTL